MIANVSSYYFQLLRWITPIWMLSTAFVWAPAAAGEPGLTNIIVTNTPDDLLVYMEARDAFTREMEQAVLNGIPASFTFFVNLYKVRGFWPDKRLVKKKVTHVIKFDAMRDQFLVKRSWESGKEHVVQDLAEAKRLVSEVNRLDVLPLSRIDKQASYQIRLKAQFNKVTLPLNLHRILFFTSIWDYETVWYTIDFVF